MSKTDKKIEELGYKLAKELRKRNEIEPSLDNPSVFLEYRQEDSQVLWADNAKNSLNSVKIVQLFCHDPLKGYFAIRSEYEKEPGTTDASSGGDREYGYVLRGMTVEELKIFMKKMRELRTRYLWRGFLQRVFGRG